MIHLDDRLLQLARRLVALLARIDYIQINREQIYIIYKLYVCVGSVWVPCVTFPSGGGSSAGSSPLCGSPVGGG